jgi:bifunctional non-homologous end joining protein LigD
MGLETYHAKRDFRRTPEPRGKISKANRRRFVVQEHHASMLHFDFRLEMGGVLKSWSVRRGPSLDPAERRLAVETEDHPVEYLKFEGHIPEGNYGAGEHMIWDEGTYELTGEGDALAQFERGRLTFSLTGGKLRGAFNLVRMPRPGQWLLIKSHDEHAVEGWQLELRMPDEEWSRGGARTKRARERRRAEHKEVRRRAPRLEDLQIVPAGRAFRARNLEGDLGLKVGRDVVAATNLAKVYWPEEGYTKGDLLRYYHEISKTILPYLRDRPLIMKRYPDGIAGKFFHQHDVNEAPDYVRTEALEAVGGQTVDYVIGDDAATLLYMANLGAIERHPWHSRVSDIEHPDWVVFDLDPPDDISFAEICEVALSAREILDGLGLASYPKTSGSRGLHVYVPVKAGAHDYDTAAEFAERVAARIVAANTELATLERSLKKRERRRIYLDHMQNARGKSVVAPYSVRPRAGATVSAPLEWREVERKKLTPRDFDIKNIVARVARKGDLFKPVLQGRQTLDAALDELRAAAKKKRR